MNCHDFEKVVNDLAEGDLMEASIKEKAMAHAKSCVRCVARLSKEKFLTDALRLAAKTDTAEASAKVKTNLLAAFQARHSNSNVVAFAPVHKERSSSLSSWKWAIAAAIMIMLLGFAATRLLNTKSKSDAGQVATPIPEKVKDNPDKANGTTANTHNPNQDNVKQSPRTPFQQKVDRRLERKTVAVVPAGRGKTRKSSVDNTRKNEVTSDYIALTYIDETSAIDSGMVVRVKVPRATLIAMGLQLNTAQTEGYVKADLVIGDDGVARAIRLVQNSSNTEEINER